MSILQKLQELKDSGAELRITPQEYQELCIEVHALGDTASQYDELVLEYIFSGARVTVGEKLIAEGSAE